MIDKQAILDERARRLAVRGAEAAATPDASIEVATFTLAGERYAIETHFIREVIPLVHFTPVPRGPKFLFGIVNLYGTILAVFDLRPLLGLEGETISDVCRVIVLGTERAEFGVIVDAVHEVTKLPASSVLDLVWSDERRRFVRGMTKEALALLDGRRILDDAQFLLNEP